MNLYSIMPLFTDHVKELCDDIERQYREGISTEALFIMSLAPEGNPAVNKASLLCKQYDLFKEELDRRGLHSGVLVQSTIGHGYPVGVKSPFQTLVAVDGTPSYSICPLDEDFRAYIKDAFREIALRHPSSIMVDDDFRLFARGHSACACPLHLDQISRRYGKKISREMLYEIISGTGDEAERLMKIFYEVTTDSLIGCARAMREGIDSVDPTIQGTFCNCGHNCEGTVEIARILAGKGNPSIVRVNNGRYTASGARKISHIVARCASQTEAMRGEVDVFLAETDTCPHNRYSTGAHSLHTHFTASILEGAGGCKHWITRLTSYEPESGEAYRRILSKYAGFYNELYRLTPHIEWLGARIPVKPGVTDPTPPFVPYDYNLPDNGWGLCVMERLGLPFYYGSSGGAVLLEGKRDGILSDSEVDKILHGTVLMAFDSAKRLIERGFGELIGVDVYDIPSDDKTASLEIITDTGCASTIQQKLHRLVPRSDAVISRSTVVATPNGKNNPLRIPLFPGVTDYKNEYGGHAVVFAGTPLANFTYSEAFSFLNQSRKVQLVNILRESGHLPVYYPGDQEVYLKAGRLSDGSLIAAFFNISLDPIDEITLECETVPTAIEVLRPDGRFEKVSFTLTGNQVKLNMPAHILTPVILKLIG